MSKKFSLHLAQTVMSLGQERIIRKNIERDDPGKNEVLRRETIQKTKKKV